MPSPKREFLVFLSLLSVLILDLGRVVPARAQSSIRRTPAQATGLDLTSARNLLKSKDFNKVIEILSPRLDTAPREAFLLLAEAYSGAGNHMMAAKTLNTAQAKYKNDREISTELGRTQFALNKEREAKAILKEVIDQNPKYEPAYMAMAEIYEKRKNRYELRLLYQDLVENTGEKSNYMTKLCELSTKDGLYDLSFNYCERGLALNAREPLNYIHLATAYKETGQSAKANQYFKKAADSFSKSEDAQASYAQFLDESKNYVQSYKYWKRATEAAPESNRVWTGFAFSSLEIQKYADTLKAFGKLCEQDRDAERQIRRAAGILKPLNQTEWFEKLTDLISKCASMRKTEI